MDFPSREELIANHYATDAEIGTALGVDSLAYLSVDGMLNAVPQESGCGYCTACFSGVYPVDVDAIASKYITEE
jgi:amidophosphoribosyltransferase